MRKSTGGKRGSNRRHSGNSVKPVRSRSEELVRPVLVTGFEPYGGRGSNPAYDTMRALDGRKIGGVDVTGRALPVAIASIKTNVAALLEEIRPSAVISL